MRVNSNFNSHEYYSRQTVLAELGEAGQERLRKSHVTQIGLGGLGSVTALYLTLAGVGKLTLIDQDTIELNNLHRQALYTLADIRHPKVEVAAQRLAALNPEVRLESIAENVNEENVQSIIGDADCIVDGLDNMRTRYLLNRYCVKRKIPLIFGGAIGLEGNVAVFKSPETPCLECVLPNLDDSNLPTCNTRGVLGATPGIIGALQAMETVKLLVGFNAKIESKLMVFDFAQSEFRTINLQVRENCPVCQTKRELRTGERRLAWLCGSNTANVNPDRPLSLDLEKVSKTLSSAHKILLTTPMVLVFEYHGHEVSIFKRGRMLIKNVETENDALKLSHEISKIIEG
jgi:adenylyltransferase/sulfurtransferase